MASLSLSHWPAVCSINHAGRALFFFTFTICHHYEWKWHVLLSVPLNHLLASALPFASCFSLLICLICRVSAHPSGACVMPLMIPSLCRSSAMSITAGEQNAHPLRPRCTQLAAPATPHPRSTDITTAAKCSLEYHSTVDGFCLRTWFWRSGRLFLLAPPPSAH